MSSKTKIMMYFQTTTDKEGQCTNVFQGTSAAGPVASGIIAMALQAKLVVDI